MSQNRFLAALLLMSTCLGCQSMWGMNRISNPGLRTAASRENPGIDDPWVKQAGDVAREEHPPEEIVDPLGLRNFFTSEKAREIERNVGVGD